MQIKTTSLEKAIKERPLNHQLTPRRMGVEIELSGIEPQSIATLIKQHFGGDLNWVSPFELELCNSSLGLFKVELDSKQVKQIGEKSNIEGNPSDAKASFEKVYVETVKDLASHIVPWEIVTAPIEFSDLPKLFPLIESLRDAGAKGTKAALRYAFGVHLNPELPDLSASTILNYLKSFFCLYDWIKLNESPDVARRITPHINHFKTDYILKVLDPKYSPNMELLIRDYLDHNPTRNRSLDMLPLFAFIEPEIIRNEIADDRINARPTFHYRLPNCEIGREAWNLDQSIEIWMIVEELAFNPKLQSLSDEYRSKLAGTLPVIGPHWAKRVAELLSLANPRKSV